MAKLTAGIFSEASGHNNGLVFGKARTRDGKKTTVRQLVKPSNPNTNAQQSQRGRFSAALQIVKSIGRSIYSIDWQNAVDNLPGFQSLMSIMTNALSDTGASLSAPASATLGSRHFPDTFAAAASTDQIDVTWSTELGEIGAADDDAVVIAVEVTDAGPDWDRIVILDQSAIRSEGSATISHTGVATGDFAVGLYFKSSTSGLPSDQIRSEANWLVNT